MTFVVPIFQQPLFSRFNERYVSTEAELVGALRSIANSPGTTTGSRSIVLTKMIPVKSTIILSSAHNGVSFRGIGLGCGVQPSASLTNLIYIDAEISVSFSGMVIEGDSGASIFATNGMTISDTAFAQVSLFDCIVSGRTKSLNWGSGTFCRVVNCKIETGTITNNTATFSMLGCFIGANCSITVSSPAQDQMYSGNPKLPAITFSATNIIIVGNSVVGVIDTSAGGGTAVISGNILNGFVPVTHASDLTNGNNLP